GRSRRELPRLLHQPRAARRKAAAEPSSRARLQAPNRPRAKGTVRLRSLSLSQVEGKAAGRSSRREPRLRRLASKAVSSGRSNRAPRPLNGVDGAPSLRAPKQLPSRAVTGAAGSVQHPLRVTPGLRFRSADPS